MKRILGIDSSSTTIGLCVLDFDPLSKHIKYVSMSYIKPIKIGSIMERIVDTRDKIINIIDTIKPDYIGVEDIIKYMPTSTASTVIVLTTFNRMLCLLAYDYLGHHAELFDVQAMRRALKLSDAVPKKPDMPEVIAKHLSIDFPYKKNKKGNHVVENEDMADAAAVALYYAYVLIGKIIVKPAPIKTKSKVKSNKIKKSK